MNIRTLQRDSNTVSGRGGTSDLYVSRRSYFSLRVFALSKARRFGYFNLVDKAAVDYVHERVGGNAWRHGEPRARRGAPHNTSPQTPALNVLYVLSRCTGQASPCGEHRQLFFSCQGGTQAPALSCLGLQAKGRQFGSEPIS